MKILSVLNVSNVDDLECDSGVIFQRILAKEFKKEGIDYVIVGPNIESFKDYTINGAKKAYAEIGGGRYYSRFNFDWTSLQKVIDKEKPDIIFNNQIEITSALRAILVSMGLVNIKIISYCHYPAITTIHEGVPVLDSTLDHQGLGIPIVFDILSALRTSDAFIIQSEFAKSLIDSSAQYHRIGPYSEIKVIPPPADPILMDSSMGKSTDKKILYNNRLYESYGTKNYLEFINGLSREDIQFVFSDPMPKRSGLRKNLSGSPTFYRELITHTPRANLIDGNIPRDRYKGIVSDCRVAFAAMRQACCGQWLRWIVWVWVYPS